MTSGSSLPSPRSADDTDGTRSILRGGVVAFGVGLLLAVALVLLLQHENGILRYVPAFAAWYFACAAWLVTTLVLMRQRPDGRLAVWTGVGLFALGGTLAVLLLVARTDGAPDASRSPDGTTVPAMQVESGPPATIKVVPATPSRGSTGAGPSGESGQTRR